MIKNEIDQLLAKYWDCETTLDEELLLKKYFKGSNVNKEHLPYQQMFNHLSTASTMVSKLDTSAILGSTDSAERNTVDDLLAEYWSGESSIADEEDLRLYFRSGAVAPRHQEYKAYFNYLSKEQSKSGVNLDVKTILATEKTEKKEAVIRPIGSRLRSIAAAIAILAVAGIGYMSLGNFNNSNTKYAGKVTVLDDATEQEEALEITKEALALLSDTFGKGQASLTKEIEQVNKLNLFF